MKEELLHSLTAYSFGRAIKEQRNEQKEHTQVVSIQGHQPVQQEKVIIYIYLMMIYSC